MLTSLSGCEVVTACACVVVVVAVVLRSLACPTHVFGSEFCSRDISLKPHVKLGQ